MDDLTMVFCTCDSYADTWNPFFTLLKKYWPSFNYPIIFNSEKADYNFDGFSIDCSKTVNDKNTGWSERLLNALKKVDTEFVLFMLDDFWLTDYVDASGFNRCLDIMRSNRKIGFICLFGDKKEEMLNDGSGSISLCEYPGFYEASSKCSYRVTTQAGIWRTKYLKKLIKGYEDAWRFEYWASRRSKFLSYRCLDVIEPVIKYPFGGIVWGGKLKEEYFDRYPEELLSDILKHRPVLHIGDKYEPIFKTRPLWQQICSVFPSVRLK